MRSSKLSPLSGFLALATLVAAGACTPTAEGGPVDNKARAAEGAARKGITQRRAASNARMFAPSALSGSGPRTFAANSPFERHGGYLVRGTDLLLFIPCGDAKEYYVVGPPAVLARVRQFYRFATRRPYIPVYIDIQSRLVKDTLTVGDKTFDHLVEVKDFRSDSLGTPKCPRPTPGQVLDRLRKFEPNL